MSEGIVTSRSKGALGGFLDEWLELQQDRLRPWTWHGYAMAIERIKRGLGKAKLQAIMPLQIESFYGEMLASGFRKVASSRPRPCATPTSRSARLSPTPSGPASSAAIRRRPPVRRPHLVRASRGAEE